MNERQQALITQWKQDDKEAAKTNRVIAYDSTIRDERNWPVTIKGPSKLMSDESAYRLIARWRNELDAANNPNIVVCIV